MQVFIPYASPLKTAIVMRGDKRFHKQILETKQILAAIEDPTKGYANHPVTKMYSDHSDWLKLYLEVFVAVRDNKMWEALDKSKEASKMRPEWMTDELCDQHKRRLYTKAPYKYPQFAELGESLENWYVVENTLKKYINGKLILQNEI